LVKFGIASLASFSKKQPSKVVFYFIVKGVGSLNYALLSATAPSRAKSSLLYPLVSFLWERKGILLTKRRPFLSQALSNPTARERLLRYAQFYLALSRRKFLNLRFRDAGLGGQNLKPKFTNLTLNLNLEIKAKYFEMDLNVVRKFSSQG